MDFNDINLTNVRDLNGVWIKEDDWTGLTDPVERRKRQNRLHQRAWRRKKKANNKPNVARDSWTGHGMLVLINRSDTNSHTLNNDQLLEESQPQLQYHNAMIRLQPLNKARSPRPLVILPLIPYLTTTSINSPLPPIIFPLSPDHHLITLVQYNVLRALLVNMTILSLVNEFSSECGAAFSLPPLPLKRPSSIPPGLQPTGIEQNTPYYHRVGMFPYPSVRCNLILLAGCYDEDDLCCDVVGGLYEGFNDVETRGIMIWGEPWSPDGWEASEGFVKKWGFLLKGCVDLIESTNRWREQRGEERLTLQQ